MMHHVLNVEEKYFGQRLDVFISDTLGISRSRLKKSIVNDSLTAGDKRVSLSYKLKAVCQIQFETEEEGDDTVISCPEGVHISIVYEDDSILILNKPKGISVHRGSGKREFTVVDFLEDLYPGWSHKFQNTVRPGIVHRLDKDTSGALLIAKDVFSLDHLQTQFKNRTVKKEYHALVYPKLQVSEFKISAPITRHPRLRKKMMVSAEGKVAYSEVLLVKQLKDCSYIKVFPRTGRTHQVRVHMRHVGHPLIGDKVYGFKHAQFKKYETFFLHAYALEFSHSRSNQVISIHVPLPDYFMSLCV